MDFYFKYKRDFVLTMSSNTGTQIVVLTLCFIILIATLFKSNAIYSFSDYVDNYEAIDRNIGLQGVSQTDILKITGMVENDKTISDRINNYSQVPTE